MVSPPPVTMLELRSDTLQIDARSSVVTLFWVVVKITIQFFLRKADYYVETYKRWFHFLKILRIFFPGL